MTNLKTAYSGTGSPTDIKSITGIASLLTMNTGSLTTLGTNLVKNDLGGTGVSGGGQQQQQTDTTVSGTCTSLPTNAIYFNNTTSYSLLSAPSGTTLVATTAGYSANPTTNTCQYKCGAGTIWDGSFCVFRNALASDTSGWTSVSGSCASCISNAWTRNLGAMTLLQCEVEAAKNKATMFYPDAYQHPASGTNSWRWRVHGTFGVYSPSHSTHYESSAGSSYTCGLLKQVGFNGSDTGGSGYNISAITEGSPWATGTANGYTYRVYRMSTTDAYACSLFLRVNGLNMYGKWVQSMLSWLTATMNNGINSLCTHGWCGSSYGYLSGTSQTDLYGDSTGFAADGFCYGYTIYR